MKRSDANDLRILSLENQLEWAREQIAALERTAKELSEQNKLLRDIAEAVINGVGKMHRTPALWDALEALHAATEQREEGTPTT